jgi:hypothetical protein
MREQIDRKRAIAPDIAQAVSRVSFTTQSGQVYDQVRWALDDDGLSVLTSDGWTSVPLADLPANQSSFPADLRKALAQKSVLPATSADRTEVVNFTSNHGKVYTQAKVFLGDNGLHVLTSDGWITVPFIDLPAHLPSFPDELRHAITQRRASALTAADRTEVVCFTTSHGEVYTQAKAVLASDGLRILTSGGWITVPFRDLPQNISAFPSGWQPQILAGRSAPVLDPSGMEVISFTTKRGKHYDQVRAAVGGTGLRLVTSEGWIEVPFNELPRDVTVFPEDWRATITEREAAVVKEIAPSH